MAYRDTVDCPKCESIVFISERPEPGPGAKYMNDIYCPKDGCHELLMSRMSSGSFDVHLTDKHLEEDEY